MSDQITRGKFRIELVALGESLWGGDFDEDREGDVEVLRFDILMRVKGEGWAILDDGSYCTRLPVSLTDDERTKALEILMNRLEKPLRRRDYKHVAEELSWIEPKDLTKI